MDKDKNSILIDNEKIYVRHIATINPVFSQNWDNENQKIDQDVYLAREKYLEQQIQLQELINIIEKFTIEIFNKSIDPEFLQNISDTKDYFYRKIPDHIPYDLKQTVMSFIDRRFIQDLNQIHNYLNPMKTAEEYFRLWDNYRLRFTRTIKHHQKEKHEKMFPKGTDIQKPCFCVFYYKDDTGAKHKFEFDNLEEAEKFYQEFLNEFKEKYDATLSCEKKKYS